MRAVSTLLLRGGANQNKGLTMERARAALALAALVAVSSAGSPSVLAGSPAWRVAGAGALLATNVAAAPDQRRLDDTSCEAV